MIDVIISGINGKMGKEVYLSAEKDKNVNVVCGVDKHPVGNFNCPVFPSFKDVTCPADVVVDFSSPSALCELLTYAGEYKCALVLATTGYDEDQLAAIRNASHFSPVCLSENFSKGIAAIKKALSILSDELPDFDAAITEAHRRDKKDKPSGTALALSDALGRQHTDVISLRCGDIPGKHEVVFAAKDEVITITHTAYSRSVFAIGALEAAKRLVTLPVGLYDGNL